MAVRSTSPPATGIASWQREAVHVWGWDGVQSMAPVWLHSGFRERGWPAPPANCGYHSSLDVVAPSGERLRPMSVRLDAVAGIGWLRGVSAAASDSVRWFGALAALATRVVDAGEIVPRLDTSSELAAEDDPGGQYARAAHARWSSTAGRAVDDALDAMAAAIPPICLPDVPRDDASQRLHAVHSIFAAFVDCAARARLQVAGWMPDVPRGRDPVAAVARAVFGALVGQDHRVPLSRAGHHEGAMAIADALRLGERRAGGEPALRRRLRLAVPDDRFEPWLVELELVDEADPGRWCSARDVWDGNPLAVEVAGGAEHLDVLQSEVLALAALVSRHVPVLSELAAEEQPAAVALEVLDPTDTSGEAPDFADAEEFLAAAPAALERLGVELIGPEHLVRAAVAVRGRATPSPASDRTAGLNRETIISWSFTTADRHGPAAISEAELARAAATGSSLLHTGNRWVRIDPAALRKVKARHDAYLREAEALSAAGPLGLVQLAAEMAAAGDELTAGDDRSGDDLDPADGSTVSRSWQQLLVGKLGDTELTEEHESALFRGELRPYQRRGLSWLRFLDRLALGGCLADDMGLGKTATTLAHLVDRPGPHLVVCPLSVVHNWETEAERFTPSLRIVVHHGAQRHSAGELGGADVVVTTYGLVSRDLDVLAEVEWSTAVLDEAQFVKNPATRAARAVRQLRAFQRIALTGTPVENRLSELWAILDWVNPGMLGSREKFRQRYSKPIERGDDPQLAADAANSLQRLTRPFVLRRSKADRQLVPELPDKIEQVAYAGLTREQALLYQRIVDELLVEADQTAGMKRRSVVLAALTKLKQICNHPAHALGDASRLAGRSGKLARFDELVDELVDVGERALVFTQFVEMGSLLQRHLAERCGWTVPFLHGSLAKGRRDRTVAAFQAGDGPPLLLVSLKAGGTGLNLTAASQVIHYDRWWNPAVENQATDRAWRIGQGQTVLVHKLVCEGTVEERIATVIDDKQALADLVVGRGDHGEAWLSELSTAELGKLVRLEMPGGAGAADGTAGSAGMGEMGSTA